MPTQKKTKKKTQAHSVDRISLLPDGLIVDEILPRLKSTKYAIRTGALSKRWQHLWTSISCLHFDSPKSFGSLSDFYLSVEKTLVQCQVKNLKKFTMSANYDLRFESRVKNCLHLAISSKVQQLDLSLMFDAHQSKLEDHPLLLTPGDQFALEDDSFFINPHFTHLSIDDCRFNPAVSISWNNLTTLSISHTRVVEELIAIILSGSPSLVTLSLSDCYDYSWLDITSKSVKNLVVSGFTDEVSEEVVVVITAPYISSLSIMGTFIIRKILLRDVSSLVKVDLDYTKEGHEEDAEEMFETFIRSLHHVKELKIGIHCYEAFSRLEAKGFNSPSNLKVVEVTNQSSDTDSTDLSDSSDNDSPVDDDIDSMERADCFGGDLSRHLQSVNATFGRVQATQRVILSQLATILYDLKRYQPLLERLAQEDARAAGVELDAYAPPQVLMLDDDQVGGDEGDPAAGREVGADDDGLGDNVGDVGAEEADVRHED